MAELITTEPNRIMQLNPETGDWHVRVSEETVGDGLNRNEAIAFVTSRPLAVVERETWDGRINFDEDKERHPLVGNLYLDTSCDLGGRYVMVCFKGEAKKIFRGEEDFNFAWCAAFDWMVSHQSGIGCGGRLDSQVDKALSTGRAVFKEFLPPRPVRLLKR